ncbi:SWIM zinc finger family protein [Geodermatophilus sabuli]|uniref:SWIM zinc finger family protein n=1 Tax=Geodermatophilus sabuli TaxID=1564158 RepID=UPI00288A8AE3|nr:SWIM zinc finger family protein [Geodermatophilus sabuli]
MGARWWGECSCPVGADCKHVAAVLIAGRSSWTPCRRQKPSAYRAGRRRSPTWCGLPRRRGSGRAPRSACSSRWRRRRPPPLPRRSACARSYRAPRDVGSARGCPGGPCSTTTTRSAIPRMPPRCARCTEPTGRPTTTAPGTTATATGTSRCGSRSSAPRCGRPCSRSWTRG